MDRRFEKRLALAANPRMRKRHEKRPQKFERPGTHIGEVVRDMLADDPDMPRGGGVYDPNPVVMSGRVLGGVFAPAIAARNLALAATMDGMEAVRRRMGKKARLAKLRKRRTYYAAEQVRRAEQSAAIRAARPAPKNPCPTPEQLIDAYRRRREGDEWRRFGELMIDLEEHARREYGFAGHLFSGSKGGVKDWLKANCPILAEHYSTCQRYKRLAQDDSATQVNG